MKFTAIFLTFFAAVAARNYYEGYHVLTAYPETGNQFDLLNFLENKEGIDFLSTSRAAGVPVELLIPQDLVQEVYLLFQETEMKYKTSTSNVANELKKFFEEHEKSPKAFDLNKFNTFDDILSGLNGFVSNCPSGYTCNLEDIGTTHENKPIRLLKITNGQSNRDKIWFDSAIHAREWLAPATNLKFLDTIIAQQDSNAVSLLRKYDFYFVIIVNPDGYIYSWESERFWRKNRTPNAGSSCIGTDLNRNYDAFWGNAGTSTNPCSNTYGGPSAASEKETIAVQNYLKNLNSDGRVRMLTSIHTTAQMILKPYGHVIGGECALPADHANQTIVTNAFADAIQNTYNTDWARGTACLTIYPASGATMDYAYDSAKIKYTFTPELRGPGFDPPASAIEPSYVEMWNGFVAAIAKIEEIEKYN